VEAQRAEIAKMQSENRWVMAGDLLFPEGGYQLSSNGEAALNQYVPRLRSLQNVKVVVYDHTDNEPVGPALKRAGIASNVDLSSRRADVVVAYFRRRLSIPTFWRRSASARRIRLLRMICNKAEHKTVA
jgi:chemotaxis protein MotB